MMDECRFDLFIDFLRKKIELLPEDEGSDSFRNGMLLALVDAEIIRDATPEWLARAEVN